MQFRRRISSGLTDLKLWSVVFIALRAIMLVSDHSVGAEDETGASVREILGVKVLPNAPNTCPAASSIQPIDHYSMPRLQAGIRIRWLSQQEVIPYSTD